MTTRIAATINIVIALDKKGSPNASDVAPDTKEPTTEPREKNA